MVLVKEVTDDDVGLKVLHEAHGEPEIEPSIVAIHTHQAHPDDTWCKNTGSQDLPQHKNWLQDMLPAIAPKARVMRYGYQSQWFGKEAMLLGVRTVAQRLLVALQRTHRKAPSRRLIFIAHGYGGLIVLKALVEARNYPGDWGNIFSSVKGLIFFGTPFGGVEGYVEKLQRVQEKQEEGTVCLQGLEVLRPGDEFLVDLVKGFNRTQPEALIACVYQSLDKPVKVGSGPDSILINPNFYLGRFHGRREVWLS
ncbi:hypothetical protein GQ44DRAFT_804448 [Phaeosphaeriaceae sp. PMI808]|nr:hypothetical protein GQ44DRAFT_804448 [Phaeosphaeriaceae sp. PMI808]